MNKIVVRPEVKAGRLGRLQFRAGQRGQQHRRQDGDNRDDDQQFDKSESLADGLSYFFLFHAMVPNVFEPTGLLIRAPIIRALDDFECRKPEIC